MRIREEQPADIVPIACLLRSAFVGHPHSSGTEAGIVDRLRRAGALALSLVAQTEGRVIGHVAFSPVTISDGSQDWYGLGPVAVLPERQGQGIGQALVRDGLRRLQRQGAAGCVVLGEPGYYRRFGFVRNDRLRLQGLPPEYFMAVAFRAAMASGQVAYHPAFGPD